jgi:hypothetical protein
VVDLTSLGLYPAPTGSNEYAIGPKTLTVVAAPSARRPLCAHLSMSERFAVLFISAVGER